MMGQLQTILPAPAWPVSTDPAGGQPGMTGITGIDSENHKMTLTGCQRWPAFSDVAPGTIRQPGCNRIQRRLSCLVASIKYGEVVKRQS